MAVFKCAGADRGVCDYEAPAAWTRGCPGCGRFYDCKKVGADKAKEGKMKLDKLVTTDDPRITTGIKEFDRVIGGGLVAGCTTIFYGPPGVGKSTLSMLACDAVARQGLRVLIASGEQSGAAVGKLAGRLKLEHASKIDILGLEGNIEKVIEAVHEQKIQLLVIDSLQKAFMDNLDGAVGSTSQCDAVVEHVTFYCQKHSVAAIIMSHVTKEGSIKGSTGVSHDVDTLLELDYCDEDGERIASEDAGDYRLLSISGKNRNGPSGLSAMFKTTEDGITAVRRKSGLHSV